MTRAATYARISENRNGDGIGVDRQRKATREAVDKKGWALTAEYSDNDVSAYSGAKRKGYAALLDAVQGGELDVVVTWAADRLTRTPRELEDLIDALEANKVQVLALNDGAIDLSTSGGRAAARIFGALARAESERKSERIKEAARRRAVEGKPHGGRRRFGYTTGMELIPAEADAIREGARDVLAGVSLEDVARKWNAAGLTTPTRGRPWVGTTVRDVLEGAHLAGLRTFHGEIVADGNWPPVFDRSTHEALNALFATRVNRGGPPPRTLLGGLMVCGKCSKKMHGRNKDGRRIYSCARKYGCGGCVVSAPGAEEAVSAAFLSRITAADNAAAITAADDGESRSDEIVQELAELDARERDLGAELVSGSITPLMLQGAQAAIGQQRSDLQTELLNYSRADAVALSPDELQRFVELWPDLDTDERREALSVLIESVEVKPVGFRGGPRFNPDRLAIRWSG